MKRVLYLAVVALVAMPIVVPPSVAWEQEEAPEVAEEQAEDPQEPLEENIAEG